MSFTDAAHRANVVDRRLLHHPARDRAPSRATTETLNTHSPAPQRESRVSDRTRRARAIRTRPCVPHRGRRGHTPGRSPSRPWPAGPTPHPTRVGARPRARPLLAGIQRGCAVVALLVTRERDVPRRLKVWEPYCRELWRAVPNLAHPERLDCVCWGDRLTVALVAARDWNAALAWCRRIAPLPRRARLDAAPGLRRRVAPGPHAVAGYCGSGRCRNVTRHYAGEG